IVMDLIQIILEFFAIGVIANTILTIFGYLIFLPWFWFHGIRFQGKTTKTLGLGTLLEFIPVVNALPAWTFMVIRIYLNSKTPPAIANAVATTTNPELALQRSQVAQRQNISKGVRVLGNKNDVNRSVT
ncbi:MAG TPA: hypothetical protein VK145_02000, partial [Candidatus Nanoarchaeia archaeon]|nr:hypothetical protein [Candidatus Nanoarchaeia archaeon]